MLFTTSFFLFSLFLGLLAPGGSAHAEPALFKAIANGVYLRPSRQGVIFEQVGLANIGFIVGDRCVAVIDTGGSVKEGQLLANAIKKISRNPVCYVINTHVHPDHILGNSAFKGIARQFIGHRNLPRAIALLGPTFVQRAARILDESPDIDWLVSPDLLVDRVLELDLGNRTLILTAHAQAHTDNDLSVYDETTQTLWTGDLLFTGHIPVIGGSGSVNGWMKVIDESRTSGAVTIVPGHGPPVAKLPEAIDDLQRYLKVLRDETRVWLADDGDIGAALHKIGYSEQQKWPMFDHYHKRNVSYAYTELEWED